MQTSPGRGNLFFRASKCCPPVVFMFIFYDQHYSAVPSRLENKGVSRRQSYCITGTFPLQPTCGNMYMQP